MTFSPGTPGGKPTTSDQVATTDANAKVPVVSGPASPTTVTGLTNAHTYTFTVVAVSPDGSSPPSNRPNASPPESPPASPEPRRPER